MSSCDLNSLHSLQLLFSVQCPNMDVVCPFFFFKNYITIVCNKLSSVLMLGICTLEIFHHDHHY